MTFAQLTSEFLGAMERTIQEHERVYAELEAEVRQMSTADMLASKGDQATKRAKAVKFAEECHASAGMIMTFNHETFEAIHRMQLAQWTLRIARQLDATEGGDARAARAKLLVRLHDMQAMLVLSAVKDFHGQNRGRALLDTMMSSGHPRAREIAPNAVAAAEAVDAAFGHWAEVERLADRLVDEMAKAQA